MGLSIAISGGIILLMLLAVIGSTIFVVINELYEKAITTSEINKLNDAISKLDMKIPSVEAAVGKDHLNFTISNNGTGKFWNYDKFDLMITYDANIGGIKTTTTEQFTFEKASSFLQSGATIEFDAATPFNGNCGNPTPCTFDHTVSALGSDQIIIVGVSTKDSGITASGVTYDGLVLAKIRSDVQPNNDAESSLWYRIAPTTGTNQVAVTLSTQENVAIGALSLNKVNLADPIGADNGNDGLDDTPTVDVVTTVNDSWVVDDVNTLDGGMTASGVQIERWEAVEGSTLSAGSTQVTTSTGSYTMSWTNAAGGKEWVITAAEIKPSPFGDTCNTNASFGTNDWIIGSITNDILDPQIVNTDEVGQICTKLAHPIFANGDVQITVSTDLGHTASKSVIVT